MKTQSNKQTTPDPPLDDAACSAFLILWHGVDEWEWIEGDLCRAHEEATMDRRHLNYGRKGYSIIPCPTRPTALMKTPEDTLLDFIFGQNADVDASPPLTPQDHAKR